MDWIKNLNLADKFYEKRKQAALEIEKQIRDYLIQNKPHLVSDVIHHLTSDYCQNQSANARNGGLIGLAAVAISLQSDNIGRYLNDICPPVLVCLADLDARVRYYACESMYNICKVSRSESLMFFNEIFDALSKLSADSEVSVKNGADLLDRLMKDIVTLIPSRSRVKSLPSVHAEGGDSPVVVPAVDAEVASHPLSMSSPDYTKIIERFIPLLSERIYTVNPFTRSFLISWLTVLHSVPEMHLVTYLPSFLDGLFGFLDDETDNVSVSTLLSQFLSDITEMSLPKLAGVSPTTTQTAVELHQKVDFDKIISILIPHTRSQVADQPKLLALTWLSQLFSMSPKSQHLIPSILTSVLPSLSHNAPAIKRYAKLCNSQLQEIAMTSDMDFTETIHALTLLFLDKHEHTRVCAIEWLILIHKRFPEALMKSGVLAVLLKTLTDDSDAVVAKDVELISLLAKSSNEENFTSILTSLLQLLWTDLLLVEARGTMIFRSLCYYLDPERVFLRVAEILDSELELDFACKMVQNLGILLVTADEVSGLRKKLREHKGGDLYKGLYKCWAHNPVSLFALCLLSERYEHAFVLIRAIADDVSLSTLVQFDKFVQLLEAPVFTYLRMQLLDVQRYPFLVKTLYGVLMMLPQSSAFATLRNRLNAVSNSVLSSLPEAAASKESLEIYNAVRARHAEDKENRDMHMPLVTETSASSREAAAQKALKKKRGFLGRQSKPTSSSGNGQRSSQGSARNLPVASKPLHGQSPESGTTSPPKSIESEPASTSQSDKGVSASLSSALISALNKDNASTQ